MLEIYFGGVETWYLGILGHSALGLLTLGNSMLGFLVIKSLNPWNHDVIRYSDSGSLESCDISSLRILESSDTGSSEA